jgi:hypothetical protein
VEIAIKTGMMQRSWLQFKKCRRIGMGNNVIIIKDDVYYRCLWPTGFFLWGV